MRLAKLNAFRRLVYAEGSAPSLNTLRDWIRDGKLPGGTIQQDRFWVDLDAYDRATGLRDGIETKRRDLGASLAKAGLM